MGPGVVLGASAKSPYQEGALYRALSGAGNGRKTRCRSRTKGRRTGSAPAGGADPTTSGFFRCSLPRREPPGRRVVAVRFTAAISHEGEWYVARALEVEVTSQGHSIDEALANLREALELYFEDEALPEDIEPPIIATVQLSA